ncbi:MAG: hypothetical protein QG667_231, partial [Pseudomonadota bacterium]|nr:hypothetical protein [Pseudomonadota bacterium]
FASELIMQADACAWPPVDLVHFILQLCFFLSNIVFQLGWGNPVWAGSKVNFTVDLGVQYLKSINASLTASCNNAAINQLQCTQLKNDIAQEEAQLQDEMNKVNWWPSARIGLHYQF